MAEDDKYVPSKGNSGLSPASTESAFVRDSKGMLTRKSELEATEKRNKEMGESAFTRNSLGLLTRKSEVEANNKTLAKMGESAFGRNSLGLLTRKSELEANNNNDAVKSISKQPDVFSKSKSFKPKSGRGTSFKGGVPYGGYSSTFNFKSGLHSMMCGGGGFSLPDLSQFCPLAGQLGASGGFKFSGGHVKPTIINDVAFPTPVDGDED